MCQTNTSGPFEHIFECQLFVKNQLIDRIFIFFLNFLAMNDTHFIYETKNKKIKNLGKSSLLLKRKKKFLKVIDFRFQNVTKKR